MSPVASFFYDISHHLRQEKNIFAKRNLFENVKSERIKKSKKEDVQVQ
jgi:hypothetical protein